MVVSIMDLLGMVLLDFNSVNCDAVLTILSQFKHFNKSLDFILNTFYEIVYFCIDCFVPLNTFSKIVPTWFTCWLKNIIIEKKKLKTYNIKNVIFIQIT